MDEIERLREALRSARPGDWVTAALSALDEPDISFCGKSNTAVSADSLVRIYSVRLEHCRQDIRSDIESLLSALRELAGSTPIFINQAFPWQTAPHWVVLDIRAPGRLYHRVA